MPSGFRRCCCMLVFYEYDHYTNIFYYMVVTLCGDMAVAQAVAERHLDLHKQLFMNGNATWQQKWCMQLANQGRYPGITWPTPG